MDFKSFCNKIEKNIQNGKIKVKDINQIQGYDYNFNMNQDRYLKCILLKENSDLCMLVIETFNRYTTGQNIYMTRNSRITISIGEVQNGNFVSEIIQNYLVFYCPEYENKKYIVSWNPKIECSESEFNKLSDDYWDCYSKIGKWAVIPSNEIREKAEDWLFEL